MDKKNFNRFFSSKKVGLQVANKHLRKEFYIISD